MFEKKERCVFLNVERELKREEKFRFLNRFKDIQLRIKIKLKNIS
jgi:hypothetical protein